MNTTTAYTSTLGAGLGLVEETFTLLELWKPGMSSHDLYQLALNSGAFSSISASRLRNMVTLGFSPRYLANDALPARIPV